MALCLAATLPAAGKGKPSVAVVIDRDSYQAAQKETEDYAAAIRKHEGKKTYIIVTERSTVPDWIRDTLRMLYRTASLEGAVFVGDIPVPMIRRAHHLATAFKMNPKISWERSSIPSDRFYDDFGLEFDYLRQDEADPLLYYYDLSPKGRQRVDCTIYSARIKPTKTDPEHSFTELIAEFLRRAAASKGQREHLDKVFHFGGHGNSSESFNARIDENRAMYEQYGFQGRAGQVHYLNFDEDKYVKARMLKILADRKIDVAHLHTHGARDAQYLSKEPYTFMASEHLGYAQSFFRHKMRNARDKAKTKASLMESYRIPESWLEDYDNPEVTVQDSLSDVSTDILLEDLDACTPGVKVLILDACFNGAFLHDDYIAARYAFGHGSGTMAVFANSVNIIQDHWKNELAGLLNCGFCVGSWAKENMTLESHLFGDPTYTFAEEDALPASQKKRLSSPRSDIRAYAVKHGEFSDAELLDFLKNDPQMNVRMEAFMTLIRNTASMKMLTEAIEAGLDDSYELLRRMAAGCAAVCGAPELQEAIERHYQDPLETKRVKYHLQRAKALYEDQADFALIADPTADRKEREFTVSAQRNACHPYAIGPMLRTVADEDEDKDLRIKAAEALGWYVYSFRREEIYKACTGLDVQDEEIKNEIARTIARLGENANITTHAAVRSTAHLAR